MTLEVRPFTCSNGNQLVLTRDDDKVLLHKMDKTTGMLKPVASKEYVRVGEGDHPSTLQDIFRAGYDAEGKVIRSSKIPVYTRDPSRVGYFYIKDGTFEMKGRFPKQIYHNQSHFGYNHSKFNLIDSKQVAVDLKSIGNLARSYLNKALKYFAKVR
jgi:hypothetical protein